jgi:hypothetical protein
VNIPASASDKPWCHVFFDREVSAAGWMEIAGLLGDLPVAVLIRDV